MNLPRMSSNSRFSEPNFARSSGEALPPAASSIFESHPTPFIHQESHKASGEYVKSIIYGGLDGICSVFVSVAAVNGSHTSAVLVLILGMAKLFAGAISMGVGDWLSTRAEVDMAIRERRREEWETKNYEEGEVAEMVELYVQKGVKRQNAERIMRILSKNKKAFVDIMMAEELGISLDTPNQRPYKHGLVNAGSFMGFGVVPLIAYVIVVAARISGTIVFYVSIAVTVLTLALMGLIKGKLTGSSLWKSAVITVILGGFTAFLGWIVGFALDQAVPGGSTTQN